MINRKISLRAGKRFMKQQLRIIGGKWRSRKINFPDVPGLRPSTDRIRETVFNWLAPYLIDSICLDLFAGSGALGLESASRGAKFVVMTDQSAKVMIQLNENVKILNANNVEILKLEIPADLALLPNYKYNIIFLDPPFNKNLIKLCCEWIDTSDKIKLPAFIYIEAEATLELKTVIPNNWQILRSKKTKHVGYHLCMKIN
jgi:16S rRNA (guanine966-N2)-methyltransferase